VGTWTSLPGSATSTSTSRERSIVGDLTARQLCCIAEIASLAERVGIAVEAQIVVKEMFPEWTGRPRRDKDRADVARLRARVAG
jgi:hypothetical protein